MTMAMEFEFDFRLHADRSAMTGTQYFELVPGPYDLKHWVTGARFVHEYTFCLIEGIFERRVPEYDHFAFVDVPRSQWGPIIGDLSALRAALSTACERAGPALPYGATLNVQPFFERDPEGNKRQLASLLLALVEWLGETLIWNEVISVLGL
jgi:hypothetical protein